MPTEDWLSCDGTWILDYFSDDEIPVSGYYHVMRVFLDDDDAKAFKDGNAHSITVQSTRIEIEQAPIGQYQRMESRKSKKRGKRSHRRCSQRHRHSNPDATNTDPWTQMFGDGNTKKLKGVWSIILGFAAWFAMIFKLIYKTVDSSSHESEGRFARGKHRHHVKAPNIGFIDCTITEPTLHFHDNSGEIGLGPPPPSAEILQRQMSFQGMAYFGRDHLFPPVADLAAAGFRLVGNNIVCDGCHRAHPVVHYPTMDLSPTSLHYALCRFIDCVLCRYCCQGMDSMGQNGQEVCIRCGQTRTIRTFGHNVVIPIAENQQAMKAFVEETCCVEGCNRVVHFQPGLERCIICCGIVCRHCAGRPHIH